MHGTELADRVILGRVLVRRLEGLLQRLHHLLNLTTGNNARLRTTYAERQAFGGDTSLHASWRVKLGIANNTPKFLSRVQIIIIIFRELPFRMAQLFTAQVFPKRSDTRTSQRTTQPVY